MLTCGVKFQAEAETDLLSPLVHLLDERLEPVSGGREQYDVARLVVLVAEVPRPTLGAIWLNALARQKLPHRPPRVCAQIEHQPTNEDQEVQHPLHRELVCGAVGEVAVCGRRGRVSELQNLEHVQDYAHGGHSIEVHEIGENPHAKPWRRSQLVTEVQLDRHSFC